ncbi:MAG: DnaJ domain-containing protein [Crocinitomicaceae bacterium]|nr:DnaJ domain-containing protein [Crocinitomicaceae bacterium]MDG2441536.1 DnaJ domain-containing protein [Crocinitomicaceae bacterium]
MNSSFACRFTIFSLLFFKVASPASAQDSEIIYNNQAFHDTIIELYNEEMAEQDSRYKEYLRNRLEESILDMNDYYGYSISKWESINEDEEEDERTREMLIFVGIVGVFLILFYIYRLRLKIHARAWDSGDVPKNFGFSDDNLMEAYVRLTGMLMRYDSRNSKEKIAYAHNYFSQHFPHSDLEFTIILKEAYRTPIKIETAAAWLKTHLSKSERTQLIYFLAGLAIVDGELNHSEKAILIKFSELLDFSKKEIDSILHMYAHYQSNNKKQKQKRAPSSRRAVDEVERCSKILGVSTHADITEIKKAYRKLAKLHHPDRFIDASAAQQKIAEERFIKIQQAYEYLELRK